MRTVFYAMAIGLILISSIVGALIGLFIMGYNLFTGKHEYLPGFTTFSLSTILLLVTLSAYMLTKMMTSMEVLAESILKIIIADSNPAPQNPLASLFGGLLSGPGTIQVSTIDEKTGKMIPFEEKEFNTPEEFVKYRNELVAKALGDNFERKLEDMSIEELRKEEKKAVDSQDFETAAAIVSLIEEKKRKEI